MKQGTVRLSGLRRACAVLLVAGLLVGSVGCAPKGPGQSSGKSSAVGAKPAPPVIPPPPMLTRPESAVYSYLLWISLSYRVLDSEVSSATYDEYEEVRVDSYVQKMKTEDLRAIEQTLTSFKIKETFAEEDSATVIASESWVYRYISTKTGRYMTEPYEASYDTTYTLVRKPAGWVVHKVAATARGKVK